MIPGHTEKPTEGQVPALWMKIAAALKINRQQSRVTILDLAASLTYPAIQSKRELESQKLTCLQEAIKG